MSFSRYTLSDGRAFDSAVEGISPFTELLWSVLLLFHFVCTTFTCLTSYTSSLLAFSGFFVACRCLISYTTRQRRWLSMCWMTTTTLLYLHAPAIRYNNNNNNKWYYYYCTILQAGRHLDGCHQVIQQ